MTRVYGIKNCDTVKKALSWLTANQIDYEFCDLKTCGLTMAQLEAWRDAMGADTLINKRSTTWKQLSADDKDTIMQAAGLALVLTNPTIIKRPLLEHQGSYHVGFKAEQYEALFAGH